VPVDPYSEENESIYCRLLELDDTLHRHLVFIMLTSYWKVVELRSLGTDWAGSLV
jgi:hypothetical protein